MPKVKLHISSEAKEELIQALYGEPWKGQNFGHETILAKQRANKYLENSFEPMANWLAEQTEEGQLEYESASNKFLGIIPKNIWKDLYAVFGELSEQKLCAEWILDNYYTEEHHEEALVRAKELLEPMYDDRGMPL